MRRIRRLSTFFRLRQHCQISALPFPPQALDGAAAAAAPARQPRASCPAQTPEPEPAPPARSARIFAPPTTKFSAALSDVAKLVGSPAVGAKLSPPSLALRLALH